ncbi:hypothetical protein QEN19_001980 [Hanseniaspora menglaensis]
MVIAASIDKNNGKNILKKKRNNKKKRRTAVSSSSSSNDSSSDDDSEKEELSNKDIENGSDNDMEIEVNDNAEKEEILELISTENKSKLIRENIQLSDTELKSSNLKSQSLLNGLPLSDFINMYNINTVSELKAVEQSIAKKSNNLIKSPIDKTLKNKFLTEVFKNYSDDINSLRESNDFNSKNSLSLLANLLKDGASMFDKDTLESIL